MANMGKKAAWIAFDQDCNIVWGGDWDEKELQKEKTKMETQLLKKGKGKGKSNDVTTKAHNNNNRVIGEKGENNNPEKLIKLNKSKQNCYMCEASFTSFPKLKDHMVSDHKDKLSEDEIVISSRSDSEKLL